MSFDFYSVPAVLHFTNQNSGPSILTWAGCKLCREHQVLREVRMWASTCVYIQVLSLKLAEERWWLCHLRAWAHDMQLPDGPPMWSNVFSGMWELWGDSKSSPLVKDSGWCGGKLWALIGGRLKQKFLHITDDARRLWMFSNGLDEWG